MGNLGFQEILLIIFVFGVIMIIPVIFYLTTLQNALKIVSPQNRKMQPGQVWLLLIPLFGIVWNFMVVEAIATSFKLEYEQMGIDTGIKPTYNIGLAMSIMYACSVIPLVGIIASLGGLVCWIVYWVKVYETRNELLKLQFDNPDRLVF